MKAHPGSRGDGQATVRKLLLGLDSPSHETERKSLNLAQKFARDEILLTSSSYIILMLSRLQEIVNARSLKE